MRRLLLLALLLLVIFGVAWYGYRYATRKAFLARESLPAAPSSGEIVYAGHPPEHSFRLEQNNVLVRTVFETTAPSNSHLEIRDVLLPPNSQSKLPALPGPALIEFYSGEGTITVGETAEKSEVLTSEILRSVPSGQGLAFDNKGTTPLVLRFYIFEAK
jgi:hypothetical protein